VRKLTLFAAAALLAGCARDIQNTDAVRQAVVDYLKARTAQTGLDMNLMQVDVTSVSFEHDQARASVYFRPKTGPAAGGMQMAYVLDKKGSKWVVRGRSDTGSNPHGAGGMPPSSPPSGLPSSPMDAPEPLPPGHPPVEPKQ
jgi:hypothetical protein